MCSLNVVVIKGPEVNIVVKMLQGKEWQIKGDLVLKEGKVYISKNEKLRTEIIWLHHNTLVAEHRGKWKTTELVTRNYW